MTRAYAICDTDGGRHEPRPMIKYPPKIYDDLKLAEFGRRIRNLDPQHYPILEVEIRIVGEEECMNISSLSVGDKVRYQPGHYADNEYLNGIIKEIRECTDDAVWVVYHCNGEWNMYNEYTSEKTCLLDLKLGWGGRRGNEYKSSVLCLVRRRRRKLEYGLRGDIRPDQWHPGG